MQRKVVNVLFCDVVGSTALGESVDPEALQGLLARYFERMKAIVESHEGTVEKFIGDAVMAAFGVPVAHEDEALRACRAAVEMRAAFPELDVEGRIGVNTGEVVTSTDERLVTGDAVNVAARLQQAAQPDEILIGETTLELVRGAVETEPVEPLGLKGKSEPVAASRLVSVYEAPERSHESRFVGRDRELGLIREAWERAATGQCELATVLGDPGIGKSRLVAEAMATLDARVVRGRCLPYGKGITYWPVVEVVTEDPAHAEVRTELGFALLDRGELKAAESLFGKVVDEAQAAGNEVVEWRARLGLAAVGLWLNTRGIGESGEVVRQAIPKFERHGDDLGLARAWQLVGLTDLWPGKAGQSEEAFARGVAYAHSDLSNVKGDSLAQVADVLAASGQQDEAIAAYSETLGLYEQKENLVAAGRVVRTLASLGTETVA